MGNRTSIATKLSAIMAATASCAALAVGFIAVPAQAASCTLGSSTVAECFPDRALASAVSEAASIGTNDTLTYDKAASIRTLIPDYSLAAGIRSLEGLANLPSLEHFSTANAASLTSLDGIRGSNSLKELTLGNAYKLSDVDAVRDVPSLEYLSLEKTPLTNVSAFHDMPNLKKLGVTQAHIASVDGLRNLPSLIEWNFAGQTLTKTVTVAKGGRITVDVPTTFGRNPDFVSSIWNNGTYDSSANTVTWIEGAGHDSAYRFDWSASVHTEPLGNYSGIMTVNVTVKSNTGRFSDVNAQTPHAADIEWLANSGITKGYSDGTFRPAATVNRQDMAAFLYRLAGSPNYTPDWSKNPFTDVTPFSSHAKEILWLNSTGITKGYPDGTFGGTRPVVRQDMAAFLHRLADYMRASSPSGQGKSFYDVSGSTPHAEDINWLSKTGVTSGYGDGTFRGSLPVVRQDMAAFLHRMSVNVLKK
ncbi:S-layer homology domain-containing protein [Bifidobacterium miconisargentati]|uniref:S-layer homology domain-containing protein n=1 Tax=Bifidobacterium miconisargentati TaxID=2834437 RepID=UPI001BDC3BE3|nr:S-layer homology domain-containing protein [Bifidobacterium miconisargentati]MBW3091137.1 S-layer homology domain-containing protein [Bifidobacterium miconisargentati]